MCEFSREKIKEKRFYVKGQGAKVQRSHIGAMKLHPEPLFINKSRLG